MAKRREIICEYQPYFDFPQESRGGLYDQACRNDSVTVNTWRETWLKQIRANHASHGPFKENGAGKLFGAYRNLPVIVAGSGPSLKENALHLHKRQGIPIVSCLHNFHFFEDNGIDVDFYVTLDAGPVTIEEVSEGGKQTPEEYWKRTENKVLVAYIGTHPDLIKNWRGKIYWFNCPLPDADLMQEIDSIEEFNTGFSTGGNVLGASTYLARGIFGCPMVVFIGADFSFGYTDKFHGWDSKYDGKLGHYIRLTDVFGNKVKTWQSYANFKSWFDWLVQRCPGIWINATEGGCFGSYPEGNIRALRQMELTEVFRMLNLPDEIKEQCEKPGTAQKKILY